MRRTIITLGFFVLLLNYGCGGGGGSGSSNAIPSPAEGLWTGSTSNGRTATGVVLDDGTYWILYSSQGNSSLIAGAVQGTSISKDGAFTSSNGKDFNLEVMEINNATVNASYTEKESFTGVMTYTGFADQVIFYGFYDSDYDLTPDLSIVSGTYYGEAATSGGIDSVTVTISTSGSITGISESGCSFSGTITPRSSGNIYNVSIRFGGGICALGSSTVRGIAYFDESRGEMYSAALNSSRSDGFICVGAKL